MTRHSGYTRNLLTSGALLAALGCGAGDLTLPGATGPATDLLLISGDEQSAEPGDDLPSPLVVRVVDGQGNPVRSAAVNWVVGAGGGSVSPGTVQTDTAGLASAQLTLGESVGVNTVNAVVSGLETVTFTASATGGGGGSFGPDHLEFMLQPTVAFAGQRLTPPVIVAVVDQNGEVVRDYKVKIEVVLAAGSGSLDGKRERDTKDGVATFDDLKLHEAGLGKVLRAAAADDAFLGIAESEPFAVLGFE